MCLPPCSHTHQAGAGSKNGEWEPPVPTLLTSLGWGTASPECSCHCECASSSHWLLLSPGLGLAQNTEQEYTFSHAPTTSRPTPRTGRQWSNFDHLSGCLGLRADPVWPLKLEKAQLGVGQHSQPTSPRAPWRPRCWFPEQAYLPWAGAGLMWSCHRSTGMGRVARPVGHMGTPIHHSLLPPRVITVVPMQTKCPPSPREPCPGSRDQPVRVGG